MYFMCCLLPVEEEEEDTECIYRKGTSNVDLWMRELNACSLLTLVASLSIKIVLCIRAMETLLYNHSSPISASKIGSSVTE